MKFLKVLVMSALAYAPLSFATIYEFTTGAGSFGRASHNASYDSIFSRYDDQTKTLTWEVDNGVKDGNLLDGFWLVLNNGPDNPKGTDGLAIFYADFNADTLWAYSYTGANNALSYTQGPLLDSFSGLTNTGNTRGFTVDVTSVFNQVGTDHPYQDEIGVWFHPTWGTSSQAGPNGLVSWGYESQSWYDRAGQPTVRVSEPTSLILLAMAMLGMVLRRKA